jgi:hypothetical protein
VVPITVHRFLDAIDECAIEVAMPGGCTRPAITNIKLYDATTQGVDACVQLACSGSPHATFTLAYVPAINTPSTYTIPIKVTLPAIDVPQVDIRFAATSRADDLLGCGAGPPRLACADVDGDGALDVVTEGSQGSCIYSVTDWRASLPWTSNAPVPGRILTEARRDVLAIGVSPPALLQLGRFGLTNAWTWTTIWASPPNEDLPADAVLIRSSASGPPDYLVGTRPGGVLRFVSRATGRLLGDVSTGLATDAYAIGVIDVAGGGQDIVLVATMGLAPQGQQIYVFRLDWSTPVDKPPAATQYALGMVMQMPNVPVSQVSITARPRLGYDDDVVVSFYEGPFAAGAAEFTVGLGSLSPLAAMGSVRSIAAASDGSVLYGHESGARRSWIDTMNNNEVVRDVIDPVLDLQPDASYGTAIAPCFDKTATLVGFVVQTGSGSFRISQLGIVPQTP